MKHLVLRQPWGQQINIRTLLGYIKMCPKIHSLLSFYKYSHIIILCFLVDFQFLSTSFCQLFLSIIVLVVQVFKVQLEASSSFLLMNKHKKLTYFPLRFEIYRIEYQKNEELGSD